MMKFNFWAMAAGLFATTTFYCATRPPKPMRIPENMSVGDGPSKALVVGASRIGIVKGFKDTEQCEHWAEPLRHDPTRPWIDAIVCGGNGNKNGNTVLPPLEPEQ